MDKYLIIIQDASQDISAPNSDRNSHDIYSKFDQANIFNVFQCKRGENYLCLIRIYEETQDEQTDIMWNKFCPNNKEENTINAKLSEVGDVLLALSDILPPPGSYLLNIHWNFSSFVFFDIKQWSPVLGALKKLSLWHLAEIYLLDTKNTEESCMIAEFIEGSCIPDFPDFYNSTCVWWGSVDVSSPDCNKLSSFTGFSMHKQTDDSIFVTSNLKKSDLFDVNLWVGNILKFLDLVNVNTIPLFYHSEHKFTLQCDLDCSAGIKLMESLKKYKDGGILCKLDYALSDENFLPCSELFSDNWRNALLNGETELKNLKFHMDLKLRMAHFLLTLPKTEISGGRNGFLSFDVHGLQLMDEINAKPLIELAHKNVYCPKPDLPLLIKKPLLQPINPDVLSQIDEKFCLILKKVIETWKHEHGDHLPADVLNQIVVETRSLINEYLKTSLYASESHFTFEQDIYTEETDNEIPALAALRNKEKKAALPMTAIKGTDSVMDTLWSNTVTNKAKVGNDNGYDMMTKLIDKHECRKILSSLSSLKQKAREVPELEHLQDFSTALTTSYHGISYNVDARASEKHDRHCRRTVEKLVKYETFSVGSKSQVPSPATMNVNDSPPKQTKPPNTPGKKKRLQKVAEKLYKKRAQSTSLHNLNSSMVLRSTPTKKKSTNLIKNKLAESPSIHKMALRSSTPTKQPVNKRRRLLSAAATVSNRKSSQKTYVQDNKKKLQDLVVTTLASNGVNKDHKKFNKCAKRLYDVSMAFLKDLKSSKGLDATMKRTVEENVKLVLSFEIGSSK